VAVIANDQMYKVGDVVKFKSSYQQGTAKIESMAAGEVTLVGVDVTSKWGDKMESGNCIMGPIGIITGVA